MDYIAQQRRVGRGYSQFSIQIPLESAVTYWLEVQVGNLFSNKVCITIELVRSWPVGANDTTVITFVWPTDVSSRDALHNLGGRSSTHIVTWYGVVQIFTVVDVDFATLKLAIGTFPIKH